MVFVVVDFVCENLGKIFVESLFIDFNILYFDVGLIMFFIFIFFIGFDLMNVFFRFVRDMSYSER